MFAHIFSKSINSFEEKRPYENTIILLRRHWFVLLLRFVVFFVMALLPFLLYFLLNRVLDTTGASSFFWFVVTIYYLVWWSSLFYTIAMYLLDVWIVTDHRIIDSQQHGYFKRTFAELSLSKIQDISVQISGFIPTLIKYGNLEVQSAGAVNKFFFMQIPQPNAIRDKIMQLHREFRREHIGGVEVHEHVEL